MKTIFYVMAASLAVITSLYLLCPLATAETVEAYTNFLSGMSVRLSDAGPVEAMSMDTAMPAVGSFFYYTRSGTIYLLAFIHKIIPGEEFFILSSISMVLLGFSCIKLAKDINAVPFSYGAIALLLIPGYTETGFAISDNITSAAIAVTALQVIGRDAVFFRAVIAGCLAGMAATCRTDAFLLFPPIIMMPLLSKADYTRKISCMMIWVLSVLTVFIVTAQLGKADIISSLLVGEQFFNMWSHFWIHPFIFFIGIPALYLTISGMAYADETEKSRLWKALFIVYPFLIIAACLWMASNIRYLYPMLLPFLVIHSGKYILILKQQLSDNIFSRKSIIRVVVPVFLAVICIFGPVSGRNTEDGPHVITGRIWNIEQWQKWQANVRNNTNEISSMTKITNSVKSVFIIEAYFETDWYMMDQMVRNGWKIRHAEEISPYCTGVRMFTMEDRIVFLAPVEPLYIEKRLAKASRIPFMRHALKCREAVKPAETFLSSESKRAYPGESEQAYLEEDIFTPSLYEHPENTIWFRKMDDSDIQNISIPLNKTCNISESESEEFVTRSLKRYKISYTEKFGFLFVRLHPSFRTIFEIGVRIPYHWWGEMNIQAEKTIDKCSYLMNN